jgi:hypothetical protein
LAAEASLTPQQPPQFSGTSPVEVRSISLHGLKLSAIPLKKSNH